MKNKTPEFQIVQYPDKDSPSGKVYFLDRKVRKKIFWFFYKTYWVTVKWSDGKSCHWFDFKKVTEAAEKLKRGEKIYA
jgi:hypothetical protein